MCAATYVMQDTGILQQESLAAINVSRNTEALAAMNVCSNMYDGSHECVPQHM